jgi:hypothetical protein
MNEDGDWMYQYSGRSFSAMNSTTIAFKGGSTTASSSKFTLADVSYTDGVTSRASATLTTFRQEDQPKVK